MQGSFFTYRNSRIGYYRFGEGPETLLCFHGYGEEAGVFGFLAKYIGSQYTIYAIDLPFHGRTEWNEGLLFEEQDLEAITRGIMGLQESATSPSFTVMGFSLGGRVALSLFQSRPEWIRKMVLLAPDGLKVSFWYWLSTQTGLGNKVFAFTMRKPGWFFGLLRLLNQTGLVNASIYKFVKYYIGNREVRDLLYARWTALRKLKPDRRRIKSIIRERNCPVHLLYGQHDRIILSSVGEKFQKGIEEQCRLRVIASGHQVLHEKHAEVILQSLRVTI